MHSLADVIEFLALCRDSHEPYSHGAGPIPADEAPDAAGTHEFHAETMREYDEAIQILRGYLMYAPFHQG